jgi:hypothetical protein
MEMEEEGIRSSTARRRHCDTNYDLLIYRRGNVIEGLDSVDFRYSDLRGFYPISVATIASLFSLSNETRKLTASLPLNSLQ